MPAIMHTSSMSTNSKIRLSLTDKDVVKMVLEFLESRDLHITQIALERETGVINGTFSNDILFLRQLILDGNWDVALDFIEPVRMMSDFDYRSFKYFIIKYKFFELLCIKNEPTCLHNNEFTVEELVDCLQALEPLCSNPEEYRWLCALLALPRLADDDELRHWNPSGARVKCFNRIYPLVEKYLGDFNSTHSPSASGSPTNSRLLQLIVRGLLYEKCMDLCKNRLPSSTVESDDCNGDMSNSLSTSSICLDLANKPINAAVDFSLFSWIKSLPFETFAVQFEHELLDLKIERLKRPNLLETAWTEHILATPIKPNVFPYNVTPSSRIKSTQRMSMSLLPQYELSCDRDARAISSERDTFTLPKDAKNRAHHLHLNSLMSRSLTPAFHIAKSRPCNLLQQSQIDALLDSSLQSQKSTLIPMTIKFNVPSQIPNVSSVSILASNGACTSSPTVSAMQHQKRPTNVAVVSPSSRISPGSVSPEFKSEITCESCHRNAPSQLHDQPSKSCNQVSCSGSALPDEFRNLSDTSITRPSSLQPPNPIAIGDSKEDFAYRMLTSSILASSRLPGYSARLQTDMMSPIYENTASNSSTSRIPTPRKSLGEKRAVNQKSSSTNITTQHVSGKAGRLGQVKFLPVSRLEDQQAIRVSAFHPSGKYFAVGTNSKQLHVCKYPDIVEIRENHVCKTPEIMITRPKQHSCSVYSLAFNPTGELLATGSNDQTIRLMHFDAENCTIGAETELKYHDGTVRDLIFIEDTSNGCSLMISGGAGQKRLQLIDCATGALVRSMEGHTASVLGLYAWGGCSFVSCSQDKTVKFWDLRGPEAVATIKPDSKTANSPVTSVCVDATGRVLVSGHEDASTLLYDIHGARTLQCYQAHSDQVRTVRFSPGNYYLLSGSYDKSIILTDMRGDLLGNLQYLPVANHQDKIVQCRWHPHDFTFLSTSADKTAILWALPAVHSK